MEETGKSREKAHKYDFSMSEKEARDTIVKFNKAYREFKNQKFQESEILDKDESDSDSSESKANSRHRCLESSKLIL